MSAYTIDVASDLESEIIEIATKEGISVEQFFDEALRQTVVAKRAQPEPTKTKRTGAEILERWREIGFIGRDDIEGDSVDYVNKMREEAVRHRTI
jgi:hypothetical protein